MNPKDDRTSLGNVLLDMGVISQQQLDQAVDFQANSSIEQMLGAVLVHHNFCTREDIEAALSAQASLRVKPRSRFKFALVAMDAAIRRRRHNTARAEAVEKADRLRAVSGTAHPAITPEMLAKQNST